jgi:hypothetical protein
VLFGAIGDVVLERFFKLRQVLFDVLVFLFVAVIDPEREVEDHSKDGKDQYNHNISERF